MATEWYQNTTWNDSVEKTFEEKLHRARKKDQYLLMQAYHLVNSHPEVALNLINRYFAHGSKTDHAIAQRQRAEAYLALGRTDDAIAAYEAALAREQEFPYVLTHAYQDLAYLIATRRIRERYDQAIGLLLSHESDLMFPVEMFLWHATYALIAADTNRPALARRQALEAIKAAAYKHSGFRYHATLGLVGEKYGDLISQSETYCRI